MKIVVPIKQMLDPSGMTIRRDRERIFINREEYIVGPGSKAAMEAALGVKDAMDAQVIAISVGEPRADDALREALAMGCNAAYLISDEALREADLSATTRVLAAAIEKLDGVDLIIVGRESGDTGAGQIGPRLAGALGCAQVVDTYALKVGHSAVQATKRWGNGYATVQVSLPSVVTVAPEAFRPRYAHGARIMNAYQQWDVPLWNLTDLDLDEDELAPLLSFRGESFPPPLEVGEEFRGEPDVVAQEVVMALRQQTHLRVG